MKKIYAGIDLFRLAAAFLVIGIHIGPLCVWNETADFLFTYCAGRVAVPFFLMTTGYFVLAPCVKSGFREKQIYRRYLGKNLGLYLISTFIYLPLALYSGTAPRSLWGFFRQVIFDGSFYHLWYFPAAITGCILLVLLLQRSARASAGQADRMSFNWRVPFFLAAGAYVVGLLGDSWYGLTKWLPPLRRIYRGIFLISSYTRNGIFYAPIFLLLGVMLAFPDFRCPIRKCRAGFLAAFACMLAEGLLTRRLGWQRHNSMYLALPFVMYSLFQLLLAVSGKAPGWLRPCSMLIYILHPAVIVLLRGFAKITGLTGLLIRNTAVQYLAVCALSLALAAGMLCGKRAIDGERERGGRA